MTEESEVEVDWTTIDPELFEGRPMVAMQALRLQGFRLPQAIELVDQRATALMEADPSAFVRPPPWDVYT